MSRKKWDSQAEYARHRGISREAVRQRFAAGRLPSREDGRIDREKADADWDANTDHSKRPGNDGEEGAGGYWAAKSEVEAHRAALLKLDLEEREHALARVDKLASAHAAIARATRTALWNLVPRLAPALAAEADPKKIAVTLEAEFYGLCEELKAALDTEMEAIEGDA